MWRSFVCAAAATIFLALCMDKGNAGMLFFGECIFNSRMGD